MCIFIIIILILTKDSSEYLLKMLQDIDETIVGPLGTQMGPMEYLTQISAIEEGTW